MPIEPGISPIAPASDTAATSGGWATMPIGACRIGTSIPSSDVTRLRKRMPPDAYEALIRSDERRRTRCVAIPRRREQRPNGDPSMRGRSLTALALAGVLTLAACGDDDDDTTDATEAPAGTSSRPAPTAMTEMTEAPGTTAGGSARRPRVTSSPSPRRPRASATLVAAVQAAGLVETLQGPGPFTVFAPTDDAFAALPEGVLDALLLPENQATLVKILTYHVLPAEVLAADVAAGEVATVEGQNITIATDGGVTVNDANVTATDVMASNGVIHVIDAVLIPPDVDPSTLVS